MKNAYLRSLLHWNSLAVATLLVAGTTRAAEAPFTEAKFTEISGEVSVSKADAAANSTTAKINDLFHAPDTLHTGRRSRAQLTAADGTIARVGSNTVFSLEPTSRTIHLTEGSILFNSPKGMGGGTIVTNSATATVTGTTIIVTATSNGGFKVLVLEGTANIKFPGGQTVSLAAGQMTFVMPPPSTGGAGDGEKKQGTPGPVLNFDLSKLVASSGLLNGFTVTLPSSDLILDATHGQQLQISSGNLQQTGQIVVGATGSDTVSLVDSSILQTATDAQKTPPTPDTTTDLTLTTNSTIPADNIVLDKEIIAASKFGIADGLIHDNEIIFQGLIGGDVNLSGNVDLGALDGINNLTILATKLNTFTFSANTVLTGLSDTRQLSLISAGSFNIPAGTSISTDFETSSLDLELGSFGAMSFSNVTIRNNSGNVQVESLKGDVTLANGSRVISRLGESDNDNATAVQSRLGNVSITGNSFVAGGPTGGAILKAGKNITVTDSTLGSGSFVFGNAIVVPHGFTPSIITPSFFLGGASSIMANGNVSITNSSIVSGELNVFGGPVTAITSPNLSTVRLDTTVAGETVVLKNVDFENQQSVDLWSATGLANFGNASATPLTGYINFLGVTYGDSDPFAGTGDLEETNIHLGITAANSNVQAALGQTLSLPTDGISEDLFFDSVMFTPSDLSKFVPDYDKGPFLFDGGVIVGTLNIGGNQTINTNDLVVKNINLTASSRLTVVGDSQLTVNVLGNMTATGNATLTVQFGEEEGNFRLVSFNTLALANTTINNFEGSITLEGLRAYLPAINLNRVNINTDNALELVSDHNGDIIVTHSNLSADNFIDTYTGSDEAKTIITNSSLEASNSIRINNGEDEEGLNGSGIVTITSSSLDGGDGEVKILGSDITVDHSDLNSEDSNVFVFSESGGVVKILSSNLTSSSTMSIFSGTEGNAPLGDVFVTNSDLESDSVLQLEAANLTAVANSTLFASGDLQLYGDNDDSLLSVTSSNLTSGSSLFLSAATVTVAGSRLIADSDIEIDGNDIAVQSSNFTAPTINISSDETFGISNSTFTAFEINLSGNLVTIQGASSLSANDSSLEIDADTSLVVVNSTLNADSTLRLNSDGLLSVTSANLTGSNFFSSVDGTSTFANTTATIGGCISLSSGNNLTLQNSTFHANSFLGLSSDNLLTVTNSTLTSVNNAILAETGNDLTIASSNLSACTTIQTSATTVTITGSNLTGSNFFSGSDGSTTVTNSTVTVSGCMSVSSGNVVSIQNSNIQSGSGNTGTGGFVGIFGTSTVTVVGGRIVSQTLNFNANPSSGSIAVSGTDIQNATSVNMSARTITLSDINFKNGSTVNLNSSNGVLAPNPNTNKAPVVGDVNFIKNVNYGGQPAQNFVPISVGGSSNNESPPIHIGHSNT